MFRYTIEGYDFDVEAGESINPVVVSVLAETELAALLTAKEMAKRDYYRTDTVEDAPLLSINEKEDEGAGPE